MPPNLAKVPLALFLVGILAFQNFPAAAGETAPPRLYRPIPAISISDTAIDAHIPPDTDPADRKIVARVMAVLPAKWRQFIAWFHVSPSLGGYDELPNHGLMVVFNPPENPGSQNTSPTILGADYVLFFDNKVQPKSQRVYGLGFDHLVTVMDPFSTVELAK
jgi:hypothetical protein